MKNTDIISLLSYETSYTPRYSELLESYSKDRISELVSTSVLLELNAQRTCTNPNCSCDIRETIENDSEVKLLCEDGHTTTFTRDKFQSLKKYKINYAELCKLLFLEFQIKISNIIYEKGTVQIKTDREPILLIPGVFRKDTDDYLISYLFTGPQQNFFIAHDNQYLEKASIISSIIYDKFLGLFLTTELKQDRLVLEKVNRKRKLFSLLNKTIKAVDLPSRLPADDLQKLLSNPQVLTAKLIELHKTDDYEAFEDYVKIAIGCLFPILYEAGTKKRGVRIPDTFGLILSENTPARRIIIDTKSIRSINKKKVKIDIGSASKYVIYLESLEALNKVQGTLPMSMVFIAPEFNLNLDKLNEEIRKSFKKNFDLCYLDLNALILLYTVFFNPVIKKEINNKINSEELFLVLFDSVKINSKFKIKTSNYAYHLTANDLMNILTQIFKSDDKFSTVYSEFLKISKGLSEVSET